MDGWMDRYFQLTPTGKKKKKRKRSRAISHTHQLTACLRGKRQTIVLNKSQITEHTESLEISRSALTGIDSDTFFFIFVTSSPCCGIFVLHRLQILLLNLVFRWLPTYTHTHSFVLLQHTSCIKVFRRKYEIF